MSTYVCQMSYWFSSVWPASGFNSTKIYLTELLLLLQPRVNLDRRVNYIPVGGGGPLEAPPSQRWSPTGRLRWKSRCRCHRPGWCPSAGCRLPTTAPAPASGKRWSWRRRTETDGTACTQKKKKVLIGKLITLNDSCVRECMSVCALPLQREFPEDTVDLLQVISVHPFWLMRWGRWVDRRWTTLVL